LDEQAELHFERAHAAKVTFIDDNNMYVTLETGKDDEVYNVPTAPTVTTSVPMSNFIISDPHGLISLQSRLASPVVKIILQVWLMTLNHLPYQ
jgi:hypothetical protein